MKRLFACLSLLTLISCGAPSPVATESDVIKIGALLQLTKEGAIWGQNSKKGIELAISEINAGGGLLGKQVELVVEDNQGDNPKVGVTAYKKLTEVDGVDFIIGPSWSPTGLATAPLAAKDGVLMISPSLGIREFNESDEMLFNVWPHDDVATGGLAKYALSKGMKKAAVLFTTQPWEEAQANTFKTIFEQGGGEVVAFERSIQTATDFRAEAVRIKQADPDIVLVCNYMSQSVALKNLREAGEDAPFMVILLDDDLIRAAGDYLNGATFVTYPPPVDGYVETYQEAYDEAPGTTSDTAYDAMMVIAEGIRKTGSLKPRDVAMEINTWKTFDGVSGKLEWDGKGGIEKRYIVQQIEDGVYMDAE